MPEDRLPCSWGEIKYRNLALQVGEVSEIETINYAYESHGTLI
jgi:hypothetical protein